MTNTFSKMLIRRWNMKTGDWEKMIVSVPGKPGKGPRDEYLEVVGYDIEPDDEGNFICENYSEEALDAVHCFSTARLTIELWETALNKKVRWPWSTQSDDTPLKLVIDDTYHSNAGFHLAQGAVFFGLYGEKNMPTYKSFDVVSHETTHALIEAYRPDIQNADTIESMAVVEALADVSPMLLQASIPDLFEKVIKDSKGNLDQPNALSEFAEGYNGNKGIRSALCNITGTNAYALASPIVQKVYHQIVRKWKKSPAIKDLDISIRGYPQIVLKPILKLKEISFEHYKNYHLEID